MIAIGSALTAGVPTVAGRIKRSRTFGIEGANGVSYEMGSDEPLEGEQTIRYLDYMLEVRVKAHSKSVDPEIELNQIKKEIIIALKVDYTLGGIARDINEDGWTDPETSGDAEKPVTVSTGMFAVIYRRLRTDPSLP